MLVENIDTTPNGRSSTQVMPEDFAMDVAIDAAPAGLSELS
jgi:hypothetical protein